LINVSESASHIYPPCLSALIHEFAFLLSLSLLLFVIVGLSLYCVFAARVFNARRLRYRVSEVGRMRYLRRGFDWCHVIHNPRGEGREAVACKQCECFARLPCDRPTIGDPYGEPGFQCGLQAFLLGGRRDVVLDQD
jgi:hypothetical protein